MLAVVAALVALTALTLAAGGLRDPYLRDQLGPGGLIAAAIAVSAAAWCWTTGSRLNAATLTLTSVTVAAVWWLDTTQPRTRHAAPGRHAPRGQTPPVTLASWVARLPVREADIPTRAIPTVGRHAA
jgi:hypothetical protein